MKELENLGIKDKKNKNEQIYIDGQKKEEPACTLSLMMMVLDNPQRGETPDGKPMLGYEGLEDFQKASRIHEKLRTASKSAKQGGILAVKTFEMEDGDLEFVTKHVKSYKPFYTSLQWAPFITQMFPEVEEKGKK